jgi:hypothetical protein
MLPFPPRPALTLCMAVALTVPGRIAAQQRLVFTGATLIDGTGSDPLPDARVVVEAGRFTCVSGPGGCPSLPGDTIIALAGRWLTPGLIDTHVHLPYQQPHDGDLDRDQRLRFALGITTVRDAGTLSFDSLLTRRRPADAPGVAMPRLVVTGQAIPEQAGQLGVPFGDSLVRHLVAAGADAIKIKQPVSVEAWRDAITASRALGVPVYGHTWGDPLVGEFTVEAIEAGLSGVSHLIAVAPGTQPPGTVLIEPEGDAEVWFAWVRGLWQTSDPAQVDHLIDAMVKAGVWLEPTLLMEYYWDQEIIPSASIRFLGNPPRLNQMVRFWRDPAAHRHPTYPETYAKQAGFVRRFAERGGMVVAGSDGNLPGVDFYEEIRLIAEATGSPMQALLTATRNAAIALQRPNLGTIEPGKVADLVVHGTDPLGALDQGMEVVSVIKAGTIYDGAALMVEFRDEYRDRVQAVWVHRAGLWLPPLGVLVVVLVVALTAFRLLRRQWRDHARPVAAPRRLRWPWRAASPTDGHRAQPSRREVPPGS